MQMCRLVKRQTLAISRLDDVLGDLIDKLAGKVGFLKIDTEGFEPLVSRLRL